MRALDSGSEGCDHPLPGAAGAEQRPGAGAAQKGAEVLGREGVSRSEEIPRGWATVIFKPRWVRLLPPWLTLLDDEIRTLERRRKRAGMDHESFVSAALQTAAATRASMMATYDRALREMPPETPEEDRLLKVLESRVMAATAAVAVLDGALGAGGEHYYHALKEGDLRRVVIARKDIHGITQWVLETEGSLTQEALILDMEAAMDSLKGGRQT